MAKTEQVVHRGAHYKRTQIVDLQGKLEKAAAEHWEHMTSSENNNILQSDFPASLLAQLGPEKMGHPPVPLVREPLTQAEATAMATLFQWMFTGMGRSALYEVCRKAGWTLQMSPPEKTRTQP